ncbi:MAG: hypothetical protein V1928_02550 [Parcubacteria group bacterium]
MIVINRLRPKIRGYLCCLLLKKERKKFRNPKKLSEAFAEQGTETTKKIKSVWGNRHRLMQINKKFVKFLASKRDDKTVH